jgi:hypothetical protein
MKIQGPKVISKIVIPTKEEVERMEIAGSYFHFNQRLNERYRIEVTFDEYLALCKNTINIWKKEQHKIKGILNIKGIDVLVVRERYRKRKLLTALPFNNYKP